MRPWKSRLKKEKKTAIVFGASGLVGGFLLTDLLASPVYQEVICFGRRPLKLEHKKLTQHVVDFEKFEKWQHLIKGNDLFCCLGTTIKKAGSKTAFRKIDFTYPLQIARAAHKNGVDQLLLISAVGASSSSLIFYNQVKGELEEAIRLIPFWATHIFQPSLLLGEREEQRLAESIAIKVSRVVDGILGDALTKYKPVEAKDVAASMVTVAQRIEGGQHLYPSHYLKKIAGGDFKLLRNIEK